MEKKDIEIPFGAFDSELGGFEYTIPEGYEAEIKDGKVVVRKTESEDERVRKEIIRIVDIWTNSAPVVNGIPREVLLAWLEKQGKNNMGISEATKKKLEDNLNKALEKETPESWNEFLEKQGGQKSKFRVGDTIKCKYDDRQFTIKSVDLDKGTYTYTQEGCGNDIDYADGEFELVEQKPADKIEPKFKIGDTIRNKITNEVFTIINRCISLEYYHDINHLHEVKFSEQDNWELVEQNPAWSEEDEIMFRKAIITIDNVRMNTDSQEYYQGICDWLKSLKNRVQPQPKQEWSEEDRLHYTNVLEALEYVKGCKYDYDKIEAVKSDIVWFKSIRPQSKNEWDKNDELNRQDTIRLLTDAKERYLQTDTSIPKCIKWLENLSPQSHWKPSDEQMIAINTAINVLGKGTLNGKQLIKLQEQLKKLRGE